MPLAGWPAGTAPRVLWRARVGKGHSQAAVAGDRLVTMGWDGRSERVACLSTRDGSLLWQREFPSGTLVQWPGTRATPTIAGDRVFTLGQHGRLDSWDLRSGAPVWSLPLPAGLMPDPDYGFAWSPLVAEGLVILPCGSGGLALRSADGSRVWGNLTGQGSCASPVPFSHAGSLCAALILTAADRESVSLVGVEVRTGKELWRSPAWKEKWGAACVDLVLDRGRVFVTTGEQLPRCARFVVEGTTLREEWSHSRLPVYTGGCLLLDGHLYGVTRSGVLKCLDWATGAERWAERVGGGFGSLIAAEGLLFVQDSRSGEVVVCRAAPEGYREVRRARVFEGKPDTFTAPALSGGRLYCRSYEGEVVCLQVGVG